MKEGYGSKQNLIAPYITPLGDTDWSFLVDKNFDQVRVYFDLLMLSQDPNFIKYWAAPVSDSESEYAERLNVSKFS